MPKRQLDFAGTDPEVVLALFKERHTEVDVESDNSVRESAAAKLRENPELSEAEAFEQAAESFVQGPLRGKISSEVGEHKCECFFRYLNSGDLTVWETYKMALGLYKLTGFQQSHDFVCSLDDDDFEKFTEVLHIMSRAECAEEQDSELVKKHASIRYFKDEASLLERLSAALGGGARQFLGKFIKEGMGRLQKLTGMGAQEQQTFDSAMLNLLAKPVHAAFMLFIGCLFGHVGAVFFLLPFYLLTTSLPGLASIVKASPEEPSTIYSPGAGLPPPRVADSSHSPESSGFQEKEDARRSPDSSSEGASKF